MTKEMNMDADFEVDIRLERKDTTSRAWEPATGLTGVTARFAATPDGAAIGAASIALTEAGTTGRYHAVLPVADLTTLADYEHQRVYLVASKTGSFDRVCAEYLVRRRAGM